MADSIEKPDDPSDSGRDRHQGGGGTEHVGTARPGPDAPGRGNPGLLGPREFDWFVERERGLADRGSRVFCLLVVRPVEASEEEMERLARILVRRVRATDLVGRLESGGLGVLLADTRPTGAMVVAGSVDQIVGKLAIHVESTIYVYPSVAEGHAEPGADDGHDGHDGHHGSRRGSNGHTDGNAGGNGSTRMLDGASLHRDRLGSGAEPERGGDMRTPDASGSDEPAPGETRFTVSARLPNLHETSAGAWPLEDLWTRLSQPLPFWKRAVDVVLSAVMLLLLLPVFLCVAIAIRLDSPGPVFFKQKRAGRSARPFTLYKFRSMVRDAERLRPSLQVLNEQTGPVFKIHHDPRITRTGRWLRRWSLDELPQLWNVLKGDLSMVGPRSPTLDEVSEYERWQRRRLDVTGGITCIWQVSGRSRIGFREWMRMDMAYVRQHSLWLDIKLLARTVVAVITGRGAY